MNPLIQTALSASSWMLPSPPYSLGCDLPTPDLSSLPDLPPIPEGFLSNTHWSTPSVFKALPSQIQDHSIATGKKPFWNDGQLNQQRVQQEVQELYDTYSPQVIDLYERADTFTHDHPASAGLNVVGALFLTYQGTRATKYVGRKTIEGASWGIRSARNSLASLFADETPPTAKTLPTKILLSDDRSGPGEDLLEIRKMKEEEEEEARADALRNDSPTPTTPGFPVIQGYTILEEIGEGGMGEVYLATKNGIFAKKAAIKVIKKELLEKNEAKKQDTIDRFIREAKTLDAVRSEYVCGFVEANMADNGSLFIALEFVPGSNLHQVLVKRGAFSVKEAISIVRQLALGLDALHEQNIVHRDLKPGNIMLKPRVTKMHSDTQPTNWKDYDWNQINDLSKFIPVIVDFGIAQSLDTTNVTHSPIGTPTYMSPEQLKGEEIDIRSDMYALGLIFFVLMTSKLPYGNNKKMHEVAGMKLSELMEAIKSPVKFTPTYLDPAISGITHPDLINFIKKATHPVVDGRHRNPKVFIRELDVLASKI